MQTKRRADDVLEFSRVPYSDPKQKRASAHDGNLKRRGGRGWGWGGVGGWVGGGDVGGALASI